MKAFSYRRILRQQLAIFNATGTVMQLWIRLGAPTPGTYTPGQNLFTSDNDPIMNSSNYSTRFIKAKFEETNIQIPTEVGRHRIVKGIITVPMLYVSILKQSEYVDPYLDGSKFVFTGGIVDEGRVFITCEIESKYLASTSTIVQGG